MDIIAHILIVSAGPLVTSVVMAFNAKKINAQWRARRAAKRAVQA